jgi:hypothetical protein
MFTGLLPNNFVSNITDTMIALFNALSPYTTLVLGILGVAVLLSIIISSLKG